MLDQQPTLAARCRHRPDASAPEARLFARDALRPTDAQLAQIAAELPERVKALASALTGE
jgi:hypothetical protein